jgi:predicted metal-binding protein
MSSEKSTCKYELHVCTQMRQGPNPESCGNSGSAELIEQLKTELLQHNLDVDVIASKCLQLCEYGPNIQFVQNGKKSLMGGNVWNEVSKDNFPKIINFLKNRLK